VETSQLVAIPLFADLEPADLDVLAGVAQETEATIGETLISEGDPGHALFAIESGTAKVTLIGVHLRELGPGDVFGEIAFVTTRRRTATVVATSPMRLITVSSDDAQALEETAPELMRRLRSLIGDRRSI